MLTPISKFAAVCAVAALAASDVSIACTCYFPKAATISAHVEREFHSSSAVFSARVTRGSPPVEFSDGDAPNSELLVLQVWKGPVAAGTSISMFAGGNPGMCGRAVQAGQELLIYVSGPPPYGLSLCSRTGLLVDLASDIPVLNKLSKRLLRARRKGVTESPNKSLERTRER
jgi:hypothetical protein